MSLRAPAAGGTLKSESYRSFAYFPDADGVRQPCGERHRHRSFEAAYACGKKVFGAPRRLFDVFVRQPGTDTWEKCRRG